MTYLPPVWGIWSESHKLMLEANITDLEDAKERVWKFFDEGDESVGVVDACRQHPNHPVSDCPEEH